MARAKARAADEGVKQGSSMVIREGARRGHRPGITSERESPSARPVLLVRLP